MKKGIQLICLILFSIMQGTSQQLAAGYTIEKIVDGLNPVSMTIDHHGRVWLVEKNGRVLIVDENENLLPDPVIQLEVDDFNERGLLGIALHPDMDEYPYMYLYYTVKNENHNRVSRFTIVGDLAVPGSEEVILELDQLQGNVHNGGAMTFDNHDHLYIATGEAGHSPNSQDTTNLLGKILRIHPDGTIPQDNPYYDRFTGQNKSIWSMGHRNPFHLFFDSTTQIMYATDVGAGNYEEINLILPGKNYGWPLVEGPLNNGTPPDDYVDPYYAYAHDDERCAIIGLTIGLGSFDEVIGTDLDSAIFFSDYCSGTIEFFDPDRNDDSIFLLAQEMERPIQLMYDMPNRWLYLLTRNGIGGGSSEDNTATHDGALWKIFYSGNGKPVVIQDPKSQLVGRDEKISFSVHAIGNDTIQYQWYINDTLSDLSDSSVLNIQNSSNYIGTQSIYCIVSNDEGADTSQSAIFEVINHERPVMQIFEPTAQHRYAGGDTIRFMGRGIDENGNDLEIEQLRWKIDFHHDLHTHPFIERLDSTDRGLFIVPTIGEPDTNVWVRILLFGQDTFGLTGKTELDIAPKLNVLHIQSNHPGTVNVDGAIRTLPYDLYSVVGLERTIVAQDQYRADSNFLLFNQWENGSNETTRKVILQNDILDTIAIEFDTAPLGRGHGLLGEYFNDPELDFDETPVLTRIDSVISFRWGNESPAEDIVDEDQFTVRWRGMLEPILSGSYQFTITSDDGMRMWLNDDLIFDEWYNHPPLEFQKSVELDSGSQYRIHLEYFDRGGGAEIKFEWQSSFLNREVVPKQQLYPIEFGSFHARIWLDQNQDGNIDPEEPYLPEQTFILLNQASEVVGITTSNQDGFFAFRNQEIGRYRILMIPTIDYTDHQFGFDLNLEGYSEWFEFKSDSLIETAFALLPPITTGSFSSHVMTKFKVYPNPTSDQVTIQNPGHNFNAYSIHRLNGEKIEDGPVRGFSTLLEFDLREYEQGVYIICIYDQHHQSVCFKVVKFDKT